MMARKAGHQKVPSPEIPRASSSSAGATRTTRSRRSPPPPPHTQTILAVDETEDEAESRSQRSEEEEEEEDEENEAVREGQGEDINLEVDYNAENDSPDGSENGSQQEDNGDPRHQHETEHVDHSESETAENYDGIQNQQEDPSLLLVNLEELDKAAGHVLDYFLRSTKDGPSLSPDSLEKVMALYARTPEGHKRPGIDPRYMDTLLKVENIFDPIYRKATLAAFTLMIRKEELPKYFALGGWDQALIRGNCYDGVDDYSNFKFVKELRTLLYIRAMAIQPEIRPEEHPNWPDTILLGSFLDIDLPSVIPFERPSSFQKNLKGAKLKRWDSKGSELNPRFRKEILDHIIVLRNFSELVDGVPTADLEGLLEEYPYEVFQDNYLDWLSKAYLHISKSVPPTDWLVEIAKRGAEDFANFPGNVKELMKDPSSPDNLGSRSPSMHQPSRRTTGTSIVEEEERKMEPPQSSLRTASSSKHFNRDLKKILKQVGKQFASAAEKPTSRSSTGLMPPTSTQTRPAQDKSRDQNPRHSAPASVPGPSTGFNINQSLAKATKLEEKENTRPAAKEKKQKFFNETQDGRTSITFSDDNDGGPAGLVPSQKPTKTAAPPREEEPLPEVADDSDVVPIAKPSRTKRARAPSDDGEESDDFATNQEYARMRKKARTGDVVINHKASRFASKKGASRPQERRHIPPPRPTQADIPQSPRRNEKRFSEVSEEMMEPLVPRSRRSWSAEEVENLIKGIARIGPKWAKVRDAFFPGSRTDVNLKDKARNLKFEYLKRGEPLPENFEHVTMDTRMLEALRKKGIHYRNGDTAPTLTAS